jgi:hypothetical protein
MRIVTEDNVDQLLSMNYSNNINKLLHNNDNKDITETIKEINENIAKTLRNTSKINIQNETPVLPEPVNVNTTQEEGIPGAPAAPDYAPVSPAYIPNSQQSDAASPAYIPEDPAVTAYKKAINYYDVEETENGPRRTIQVKPKYNYPDDLGYYYLNLSEQEQGNLLDKTFEEKVAYLREVKEKKLKELADKTTPSILEVEQPKAEEEKESSTSETSSGEKKSVTIQEPTAESSESSSSDNGTRKFIL